MTVNLKQDARYEVLFNITSDGDPVSGVLPIFNFSLAAQYNSSLFGNHYDVGGIGDKYRGPAGVYHYSGSVANGDKVTASGETYILNAYCNQNVSGAVFWKQATYKDSASPLKNTNLPDGWHTYRIVIEAFADGEDKIKFIYDGPTGDGWTQDFDLSKTFGISKDHQTVDVGYYIADDGGMMRVDHASFDKNLRTLIPTETPTSPEPEPSVPEPSAFGLLAGLGAIALAVSRRRRSREARIYLFVWESLRKKNNSAKRCKLSRVSGF